jgi:hypothetical protein
MTKIENRRLFQTLGPDYYAALLARWPQISASTALAIVTGDDAQQLDVIALPAGGSRRFGYDRERDVVMAEG